MDTNQVYEFVIEYPGRPQQTIIATRAELNQLAAGYRIVSSVKIKEERK